MKGIASFDSAHFTVTDGFVELVGGIGVETFITDDGVPAVEPNGSGQVEILSGDASISVTGQGPGNTITITGSSAIPTSFVTDSGTAIPVTNILNVIGGNNISTTGSVNNITIDVTDTTDHCVQVGNASGSLTSLGAGTTGELLIGNTGADPAFGSTAYADFSFSNVTGVGVPRTLNIVNTDVNVASYSDLRLSVAPLGGDAMISYEVQGTLFYAMGVDNSDSDIWKLTTSSDPSGGTTAIAVDNGTAAVKFANAYEFPIADGTASYPLVTDGAGNLDFNSLTVAGGGTGVTTITDHALIVGSGANAITEIGPLTNGQLVIGSTGADPVAATLTEGTGISITNAAGSITIDSTGGGFDWNIVTDASDTMVSHNGYIANRATLVTLTLPASVSLGDSFKVVNVGAGFVKIAQNAGDQIRFGNQTTTAGAGGDITCTALGDSVEIIAQAANTYLVLNSVGNWTIT